MPEILGERCFASLEEVPERVDVVDVFRRSSLPGDRAGRALTATSGLVQG